MWAVVEPRKRRPSDIYRPNWTPMQLVSVWETRAEAVAAKKEGQRLRKVEQRVGIR